MNDCQKKKEKYDSSLPDPTESGFVSEEVQKSVNRGKTKINHNSSQTIKRK